MIPNVISTIIFCLDYIQLVDLNNHNNSQVKFLHHLNITLLAALKKLLRHVAGSSVPKEDNVVVEDETIVHHSIQLHMQAPYVYLWQFLPIDWCSWLFLSWWKYLNPIGSYFPPNNLTNIYSMHNRAPFITWALRLLCIFVARHKKTCTTTQSEFLLWVRRNTLLHRLLTDRTATQIEQWL